ncbi:MAG: hypothetical protein GKS04_02815 [Candidatus Mycalebacterium zealandia]|nr:MAG: hypothetical protein GKS04_02815 [Candidatus Mycalebacterium zealandia]
MNTLRKFFAEDFVGIFKQLRLSYIPPLMVYLAAGISGLTGIVATFFVKDYLDLSAAFLAGLGFWAGLPWALKMPVGHLVDLIWRWKSVLVFIGAALIAVGLLIVYGLIAHTEYMRQIWPISNWFVASVIISPVGYVLQDVVADAMTVEAVPTVDSRGEKISEEELKSAHTTMQTLGRFAVIGGTVVVSIINIVAFNDTSELSRPEKAHVYSEIYLMALAIPLVSIMGVVLAEILKKTGHIPGVPKLQTPTAPNWWILWGSLAFVIFSIGTGLSKVPYSEEIVFTGSMAIVIFLMRKLLTELPEDKHATLIGTAIIIFFFRAVPTIGPGNGWFLIDEIGFDEQFFSYLSLIGSTLTLAGIFVFLPLMSRVKIPWLIVFLSLVWGVLSLPDIGLFYGLHEWTAALTDGVVDAKFIAIVNTALESPLGQVAMIPLLAWIAKNAPDHLKATFFAVFASFSNLSLSAASLGSKYLNEIFIITREVRDEAQKIITSADYSELGILLITATVIGVAVPCLTVFIIQKGRYRSLD